MRFALILVLVLGCVTDPDDDHGPPLVSKVAYKDFPVAAGQLLYLGSPCWDVTLSKPYECSVVALSDDDGSATIMPSCALFPTARPCWKITIDEQNCFEAAKQKLEVLRSEPARYTHHLVANCVAY